jgi:FkbM family methyltransferase
MLLDLRKLIKKHSIKINGILHIGAHYGEEYKLYKELNVKNLIFFEPLKKNFDVLKKNISDENVVLENVALGNDNKKIIMWVESANNGQSSSILQPKLHLKQYPNIQFNSTEYVNMIKLNDYKYNRENFNFINIDVQGYELEVFKGATDILENIDVIYSEVNFDEVYKGCAKIEQLDEFLSQYGFERKETNNDGVSWGDALYVKKK